MNPIVKELSQLTAKRTRLLLRRAKLSRELEQTDAAIKATAAQLTHEPEPRPEVES